MLQCLTRCKKSEIVENNINYLIDIIDIISKIQLNDKIYVKNDIIYICCSFYKYFMSEEYHKNTLFINNVYNRLFININQLIDGSIQIDANDKKNKINTYINVLFNSISGLQNFRNNCNDDIIDVTIEDLMVKIHDTVKFLVSIRNNIII